MGHREFFGIAWKKNWMYIIIFLFFIRIRTSYCTCQWVMAVCPRSPWGAEGDWQSVLLRCLLQISALPSLQTRCVAVRPVMSGGESRISLNKLFLKGSYDVAKKNISLCNWCNPMCLCGSKFKKHIIFHILYIIVASLCLAFLKHDNYFLQSSSFWEVRRALIG